MTASALASMLHARRIGKDRWLTHCPSHGSDRHPSLRIFVGKKQPVMLMCQSHQCKPEDILAALGLSWKDVMGERVRNPVVRVRMTQERQREVLTTQYLSARLLASLEPEKRNYWRAVERRCYAELQAVRCRLEPDAVIREWRERQWQSMSRKARELYLERIYYREILPHKNPVVEL
jgi:hypothetical protein